MLHILIGIGKTTLVNEMCVKWARNEGFLAEDFDTVIQIPLKLVWHRSLEDVMIEHTGENKTYQLLKRCAGNRCLIILDGLDEIATTCWQNDNFFTRVVIYCTLFEKATIIITSRPHACEKLVVGRRIEVVGFSKIKLQHLQQNCFQTMPKISYSN